MARRKHSIPAAYNTPAYLRWVRAGDTVRNPDGSCGASAILSAAVLLYAADDTPETVEDPRTWLFDRAARILDSPPPSKPGRAWGRVQRGALA